MKKQTGIWIDSSKAIIISLLGDMACTDEIESRIENRVYHEKESDKGSFMGNRHINHDKKFEQRIKIETDRFLNAVLENVINASALYVFGPSEMKEKLKNKIEKNITLSNKLIGFESADSMTNNQIIEKVKEFFIHKPISK
jgi:hypothetical protein